MMMMMMMMMRILDMRYLVPRRATASGVKITAEKQQCGLLSYTRALRTHSWVLLLSSPPSFQGATPLLCFYCGPLRLLLQPRFDAVPSARHLSASPASVEMCPQLWILGGLEKSSLQSVLHAGLRRVVVRLRAHGAVGHGVHFHVDLSRRPAEPIRSSSAGLRPSCPPALIQAGRADWSALGR